MKSITKKLVALGASFALVASPFASMTAEASAEPIAKKLQSVNSSEKVAKQSINNSLSNKEKTKNFSDDTIIVKYSKLLTVNDHKKAGGTVIQQVSGLKYVAIKVKDKKKLQQTIKNYQKNSKVMSVQLSPIYKQTGTIDPKISEQYVHTQLNTAKAQELAGKNQVKVAVIDTGIDRNHSELKDSIISSTNIIDPMNPAAADIHGTHVAGIIAAKKDNGIGGYGVNPNAKILSFDVFGGDMWTFDYTIANAILEAVDEGAKVINMSLGGSMPSDLLKEAVDKAIDHGVVVVAAAGNDGMNLPSYPASYEGVIGVGSVNKDKKLSEFSTYGASTDIVAPGEDIYAPYYDVKKGSTFDRLSGTSMASPVVAGAAALLLSKYPKLTPAEVEYVLEKTATGLGEKGFDTKYGNGLVNLTGALTYDVKNIPSIVKQTWGQKEIVNNAALITAPAEVKDSLTKPSEQKWVKLPVEKGEYIQASLVGNSFYDYKMSIHFYGDNQQQLTDINDVKEGKEEGKLIKAPFSGTVAIGVKDVNGSYDDSSSKQSSYTLKVDKLASLPEDESTLEAPIAISSLPFTQNNLVFTGEEGEDDFFHFTSKEAQLMKFDISGIPGVDVSAHVYEKDQLFPPVIEGEGQPSTELPQVETVSEEMPPLYSSNTGRIGESETLIFNTEADKEYYIKVTNKPTYYEVASSDFIFESIGNTEAAPSALPYSVKLEGKTVPEDEDQHAGGIEFEEESKFIEYLAAIAKPYEIASTLNGYLQNTGDQDWYKMNPTATGIYQFNLPTPTVNVPFVSLYEVIEGKDEEGKPYAYLAPVASNEEFSWYSWTALMANKITTGLKANKTYYMAVSPNWSANQIPYEGYSISSKLLISNPGDKYEENDLPEQAKDLPAKGVEANFAMPNDVDTYYFTAKQTATYGVKFVRTQPTTALKNKYGEELLAPIYGQIVITEDVNKNRKLDENEYERSSYILNSIAAGMTTGSFKAKKNQSYFVSTLGMTESGSGISLLPYKLTIDAVNRKDEDAGSKVKNNTPSKPIALKKQNSKSYAATAYLNAGYQNGDTDWFVYKATKTEQSTVTLNAGAEIDGIIEVYKNGKRVAKSDYYGQGDKEILSLKLTKGTYYIKVRDSKGHASFDPYTLSLKLK